MWKCVLSLFMAFTLCISLLYAPAIANGIADNEEEAALSAMTEESDTSVESGTAGESTVIAELMSGSTYHVGQTYILNSGTVQPTYQHAIQRWWEYSGDAISKNEATSDKENFSFTAVRIGKATVTFCIYSEYQVYDNRLGMTVMKDSDTQRVQWIIEVTGESCIIAFDANGGTVSPESKSAYTHTAYGDLPTPTKAGYVFDGWYTQREGGSKITSSDTVSSAIQLYAHWHLKTYAVRFDANGGSGSMDDLATCEYGANYTLPDNQFTWNGRGFYCWNTKPDGSGERYENGGQVSNLTEQDRGIVTLYAIWTANGKIPYCDITVESVSYTYDGTAKTPAVVVKDALTILTEGRDYELSYRDNINAGTGTVTITGKGGYSDNAEQTFTIAKAQQMLEASISETIERGTSVQVQVNGVGAISYALETNVVAEISTSGVVTGKRSGNGSVTVTASGDRNYLEAQKTLPFTVTLPADVCGEDIEWSFNQETGILTLSGYGSMLSYSLDKPSPWQSIADRITGIQIEDGILTIGNYAFYNSSNLKEATIPNSVIAIGRGSFRGCENLTDMTVPFVGSSLSSSSSSGEYSVFGYILITPHPKHPIRHPKSTPRISRSIIIIFRNPYEQ